VQLSAKRKRKWSDKAHRPIVIETRETKIARIVDRLSKATLIFFKKLLKFFSQIPRPTDSVCVLSARYRNVMCNYSRNANANASDRTRLIGRSLSRRERQRSQNHRPAFANDANILQETQLKFSSQIPRPTGRRLRSLREISQRNVQLFMKRKRKWSDEAHRSLSRRERQRSQNHRPAFASDADILQETQLSSNSSQIPRPWQRLPSLRETSADTETPFAFPLCGLRESKWSKLDRFQRSLEEKDNRHARTHKRAVQRGRFWKVE